MREIKRYTRKKREKKQATAAIPADEAKLKLEIRMAAKKKMRKKISINLIIAWNEDEFLVKNKNICYTYKWIPLCAYFIING